MKNSDIIIVKKLTIILNWLKCNSREIRINTATLTAKRQKRKETVYVSFTYSQTAGI